MNTIPPTTEGEVRARLMAVELCCAGSCWWGRRWVGGLVVFVLVSGMLGAEPVVAVVGPDGGGEVAVGGFDDVGGGVHAPAVEALAAEGIFDGTECGDGLFCPRESVLRWVIAVWLVRVLGDEPAQAGISRFSDVDAGEWWAPYVETLADLGVTKGCDTEPLRFCPDESVTRAQMASFLVRAFALEAAGSAGFADTAGNTHEEHIDALAAARFTAGCAVGPLRYCPDQAVTRAQMATFLARATGLVAIPDTGSGSGGAPAVGEVVPVFDPFTTPTLSDLDLDRLAVAVATLDETVDCPPTVAPDSLDDVAEVVRIAGGCMIVEYEPLRGRTVEEVREALSADLSVHAVGVPPRDIYPDQSRPPSDDLLHLQWFLDLVDADQLWDMWPSGADVTVAVIDTGVDDSNEDLVNRVIDTGHVCHRQPLDGHGTHVAGIIAAERGNSGPLVGVAPEARILPIKIHFTDHKGILRLFPEDRDCHDQVPTLTAAITRAIGAGVDVINMSFSWQSEDPDEEGQDTVELAIRAAVMKGITVVTSAGNCGRENLDSDGCNARHERQSPAMYSGVIAVAATDDNRIRAPYSTSNRDVDIAAPGGVDVINDTIDEVILSTWPTTLPCGPWREGTCLDFGTSMAAPVVSGVVAHLKAHYPEASVADIQYALYSTADRTNDYTSQNYRHDYGHGFVNPVGAIRALQGLDRPLGEFVAVSSGNAHTCGLGANGAVECWGDDTEGQASPPAGIFTQISAGGFHTCGIREADRAVECWGNNDDGQTDTPPPVVVVGGTAIGDTFTAVAAGGYHSCGIRYDGTIKCWGSKGQPQSAAPLGNFSQVSAGMVHTCGLLKPTASRSLDARRAIGGTVHCWGDPTHGQADDPAGNYVAISAGGFHSCALRSDGAIKCWGHNLSGQADDPSERFTSVSAGGFHTCGITSDAVKCWGEPSSNQTEVQTGDFIAVAAGQYHSCGIRRSEAYSYQVDGIRYDLLSRGTIHCWGLNSHNQTEAPAPGQSTTDTATTSENVTYSAVEVGDNYSCGLRTDGTVACWGLNNAHQASPPTDTKFTAISAGQLLTCGLREDATIQCWGRGNSPPKGEFRALTVDDNHGCAIKTDGSAECWTIRNSVTTPKAEAPADVRFADIAASAMHSCGLTDLGSIECWGHDRHPSGFSGGGQVSGRPSGTGFLEVAADSEYACAIRTSRKITCWGSDRYGSVETGRTIPPESDRFLDVAPGHQHACGIRLDGSIVCWGQDTDGVLSDAPTSGKHIDISSGDFHSCALRDNGTIKCWGRNNHGQTDVPSAPILVSTSD